ncbi:MAG: Gfo/Idh/MocA family oxidoreductase [Gemmatimonadota bacterium]
MKVLRTAVVGLGRIGWQFHLPAIRDHEGFLLVGVVDPLGERRQEALAEFGAPGYADLDACLAQARPDLVVIASPTPLHGEQALAAFAAGADVFCDKPMAGTLAEADRMVEGARAAGRRLMVYQPHRGSREVVALRQILARDLIGPIYLIKNRRTLYARRNDWQAFRAHGGGMLNNYGAHHIDACLHVAGSRARHVTCYLRTVASLGDADDVVKALIETESGVLLDIDINMATAHAMVPRWHVIGERGSLVLGDDEVWRARYFLPGELQAVALQEGFAAAARRYGSGEQIPWREEDFPCAAAEPVDYYGRCHDYFAGGGEPFVPVAESRELMRVLDACRRDHEARQGGPGA